MPGTALTWSVVLHHCYRPGDCHEHLMEELTGTSGTVITADHEDLPVIELRLTATDAGGLTDITNVLLEPLTTTLSLRSNVASTRVAVDTDEVTLPADVTVVAGSSQALRRGRTASRRSFVRYNLA